MHDATVIHPTRDLRARRLDHMLALIDMEAADQASNHTVPLAKKPRPRATRRRLWAKIEAAVTAFQLASASCRPPRRARYATALAVALVLGTPATAAAAADEVGAPGRVVAMMIHTPGSDDMSLAHGSITVRKGGAKLEVYQWGGTACPASKLSDAQVTILAGAFHNRGRTLITPRFKPGEVKDVRCLVGFALGAG